MGGGKKEPEVTQIPLMNQGQSQLLNQLLSFIPQAMGGIELGQAYGGPSESSYSPFTIPGGEDMPTGGKGGGVPGGGGGRGRERGRGGRRGGGGPGGRPAMASMDGKRGGPGGRTVPNRIPDPVLDAILNSEELSGRTNIPDVRMPESQPISPIEQSLTQPIISPFTQGMTGNYPRRGRRGG